MQKRTICCKLNTFPQNAEELERTSQVFADACNFVLGIAKQEKVSDAIRLHELCYKQVRALFGLKANLAIRSIRRVSATLTRLKGKRRAPKKFSPKSIDYDARIFSFWEEKEMISLTTMAGRIRIPLQLGAFQRQALVGQTPTSATVIKKRGIWYIHMVVEYPTPVNENQKPMGVDLGINNIAATSTEMIIEGESRQTYKEKRARVRASLQSKNTKGAKKVLKRISGKEKRRITHENHILSKQLVKEAKRHDCGVIRMEQLKEIRSKTKRWDKHSNREMAGWSFYQLQQFVTYKAAFEGISIELVNPCYTSQTCHICFKIGVRNKSRFTCLTCGDQHADVNASYVIALGGVVRKPARISNFG